MKPLRRQRRIGLTTRIVGLLPGGRTVAYVDLMQGAPSVLLGLCIGFCLVQVLTGWDARKNALMQFRMRAELQLFDLFALLGLLMCFEALRLVDALQERKRRPWAPRMIAATTLPALALMLTIPSMVGLSSRLLEPLFLSGLVLFAGALPAVAWCVLEIRLNNRAAKRSFVLGAVATYLLLASFLAATYGLGGTALLSDWAKQSGFVVLPHLL